MKPTMPTIVQKREETIICPNCEMAQMAEDVLYEGAPFWAKVHRCVGCGYFIMESEWETAIDEQIELATLRHHNAFLVAVAQAAYDVPVNVKEAAGNALAVALMEAAHAGAFVPGGK